MLIIIKDGKLDCKIDCTIEEFRAKFAEFMEDPNIVDDDDAWEDATYQDGLTLCEDDNNLMTLDKYFAC